jgi:hypothetical protein
VCCGTSKANSAIVHAGYDAAHGSLMAKLNVLGSEMMPELSKELDFHYKQNGSLVVMLDEGDRPNLVKLYENGVKNGVKDLRIIEREELVQLEPNISDKAVAALYAPTGGIVCPFGLTYALAENAASNGAEFRFDSEVTGIERINAEMLKLSADRGEVKNKWRGEVANGSFSVGMETDIPKEARIPVFTFWNFALNSVIISMEISLLQNLLRFVANYNIPMTLGTLAVMFVLFVLLYNIVKKMVLHSNPANSIKTLGVAVYKTLCECDLISPSAKVETTAHKQLYFVALHLRNASIHDQNIFNIAMTEMLSPIENPRYILIAKKKFKRYNYELSFACPSIIGKKKEYVEVLAEKLKATTGNFEPVYTHREDGRRLILKCRKRSYITFNEKAMGKKYKVSHFE